jgi:hypothetical protein
MKRALAGLALALAVAAPPAWADDEDEVSDDEDEGETRKTRRIKNKPEARTDADSAEGTDGADGADGDDEPDEDFKKQDLTGHDLGPGSKKENQFERDRFFVDKIDTAKTEDSTLIQGSLTSTSFGYVERGGTLAVQTGGVTTVPSASQFQRVFTDLRLQTDFRHIAGSRWEARVDVRARAVNNPGFVGPDQAPATDSRVQSGFLGRNELDIKELWLVRSGARSDVFLGRQFIADLGGVKIDGLRIDYASSSKFTFVGFGGLYPIRGSRSITTDYTALLSNPDEAGVRTPAGKYTGAGGFGAAYRTANAYGAFGGVALVPFSSESPRVFGTSTGYWRRGTKLDLYHLAVIDAVGSNAVNAGLTNLSLGLNYRPDQRLRASLAFHRVDTETLNVQAQAFLVDPDPNINVIQNEAYVARIATNHARASLSAGLGSLQRFEVTAAISLRRRGEITLSAPPQAMGAAPVIQPLPAAQSAEVYGSITDRRSVAKLRLGVDGSRVLGVGSSTYQRTTSTSLRVFAARDISEGRGEWEAEVAYSSNADDNAGTVCTPGVDILGCYGAASSTIITAGANLYYRINRDWFTLGSLFINRNAISHVEMENTVADPPLTGVSGYFRIAYRF